MEKQEGMKFAEHLWSKYQSVINWCARMFPPKDIADATHEGFCAGVLAAIDTIERATGTNFTAELADKET